MTAVSNDSPIDIMEKSMGMTLSGTKRTLCLSHSSWCSLLSCAECYGWKPMGTGPPIIDWPEGEVWDSFDYTSNESQLVTQEDAANLADALERIFCDHPDWKELEEIILLFRDGGVRLYSLPIRILSALM